MTLGYTIPYSIPYLRCEHSRLVPCAVLMPHRGTLCSYPVLMPHRGTLRPSRILRPYPVLVPYRGASTRLVPSIPTKGTGLLPAAVRTACAHTRCIWCMDWTDGETVV
jgi:hypothetical protein